MRLSCISPFLSNWCGFRVWLLPSRRLNLFSKAAREVRALITQHERASRRSSFQSLVGRRVRRLARLDVMMTRFRTSEDKPVVPDLFRLVERQDSSSYPVTNCVLEENLLRVLFFLSSSSTAPFISAVAAVVAALHNTAADKRASFSATQIGFTSGRRSGSRKT